MYNRNTTYFAKVYNVIHCSGYISKMEWIANEIK